MKKQWIKREDLFKKPTYRHKLKITFLGLFLLAFIFFAYQLFYIKQLQNEIDQTAVINHHGMYIRNNVDAIDVKTFKHKKILR